MPLCLSHFRGAAPRTQQNHEFYCQAYQYPHRIVAMPHRVSEDIENHYRFTLIRYHLSQLDAGDWLLYMTEDCAVFRPQSVEAMLGADDHLVCDGPMVDSSKTEIIMNMMIFRNTPAMISLLHQLDLANARTLCNGQTRTSAEDLLRAAGISPFRNMRGGRYPILHQTIGNWFTVDCFCISLGVTPFGIQANNRAARLFGVKMSDPALREFYLTQINRLLIEGKQVFELPSPPMLGNGKLFTANRQQAIAFISLYTPNIASYGQISEANIRRYCMRHGYACYIYRDVPDDEQNIPGNWLKARLLLRHIENHEWVVWLDADILIADQRMKIESLLRERDILLARDAGEWFFNSGVMGFKNTCSNREILQRIYQIISDMPDKSTVYAGGGDQNIFCCVLDEAGLNTPHNVLDHRTINTPFFFADDDSFIVHFYGLGEPQRSALMYVAERDYRLKEERKPTAKSADSFPRA